LSAADVLSVFHLAGSPW